MFFKYEMQKLRSADFNYPILITVGVVRYYIYVVRHRVMRSTILSERVTYDVSVMSPTWHILVNVILMLYSVVV